MRNCYIFDIDGTLADLTHRLPHIRKEPKDWRTFFAACDMDEPIPHICELARDLAAAGASIIYVTGRSDECRQATLGWIIKHRLPGGQVFMRKEGDHRPDNIVKAEILDRLRGMDYEPIMAFDDRDRVVKQWRASGVPCAQVADGDF